MDKNRDELLYLPASDGRAGYGERVHQVFSDHLAAHGLRLTIPRKRILDHLLKTERHESLEEIFAALRKHRVGRATVFRTLKMMEECGLVSKVSGPNASNRFEVNHERPHHDHLICIVCGRIQEVRWPELEKIQQRVCRELGFEPRWHRHEIFGRCSACPKKGVS